MKLKISTKYAKKNGKKEKPYPLLSKKKPVGELGYKVDEADDIHKKRKEEWEKGVSSSPVQKNLSEN